MSGRFDSDDWQLGMELPSRKETHARKKEKAAKVEERDAREEIRRAEREVAATSAVAQLEVALPLGEVDGAAPDANVAPDPSIPSRRSRHEQEREALLHWPRELSEEGAKAEAEAEADKPLATWKVALLIVFGVLVGLVVAAWGKIGYVHHVPAFVQERVPQYTQGEAFLVVKPWWFGPPVFDLSDYEAADTGDYKKYKMQLGGYAGLLDKPEILWRLKEDVLH
ncbi:MAG TPA: hypothetical protein VFV52_01275 [Bacilli bacterium]|nr:hypothetical protein [Bacilli bacterium]